MNRVHTLTAREQTALEELHKRTHRADVRSRCQMILLSNDGLSPPKIAKQIRFSRRTVIRVIQRYEVEGISGLMTKPRTGRPPKVTRKYRALLLESVEQQPRDLGKPYSNWTTAKLAEHLLELT